MRDAVLILLVLAAGCANTGTPVAPETDEVFSMPAYLMDRTAISLRAPRREPIKGEVAGYELDLWVHRIADREELLRDLLDLYPNEWASRQLGPNISFIQDFDVEVQESDWIADPIIGVLQTGWTTCVKASPHPKGVLFSFDFGVADLSRPMARRQLRLAPGNAGAPATVQLPDLVLAAASGSVLLKPGVEVRAATFPTAGGEVELRVRVMKVALRDREPSRNDPYSGFVWEGPPSEPPAADPGRRIRVSLLRLEKGRFEWHGHYEPLLLAADAVTGALADLGATVLKRFEIPTAGRAAFLLQRSYVQKFKEHPVGEASVRDPEIDNLRAGFRCWRDGDQLWWNWTGITEMGTADDGSSKPVLQKGGGVARLDGPATLEPVGWAGEDGAYCAVLIEPLGN